MPKTEMEMTVHVADLPRVRAILDAVAALITDMQASGDHRYDAQLERIGAALRELAAGKD